MRKPGEHTVTIYSFHKPKEYADQPTCCIAASSNTKHEGYFENSQKIVSNAVKDGVFVFGTDREDTLRKLNLSKSKHRYVYLEYRGIDFKSAQSKVRGMALTFGLRIISKPDKTESLVIHSPTLSKSIKKPKHRITVINCSKDVGDKAEGYTWIALLSPRKPDEMKNIAAEVDASMTLELFTCAERKAAAANALCKSNQAKTFDYMLLIAVKVTFDKVLLTLNTQNDCHYILLMMMSGEIAKTLKEDQYILQYKKLKEYFSDLLTDEGDNIKWDKFFDAMPMPEAYLEKPSKDAEALEGTIEEKMILQSLPQPSSDIHFDVRSLQLGLWSNSISPGNAFRFLVILAHLHTKLHEAGCENLHAYDDKYDHHKHTHPDVIATIEYNPPTDCMLHDGWARLFTKMSRDDRILSGEMSAKKYLNEYHF